MFDVQTMSAFIAVAELWDSWHALRWHNLRFYQRGDGTRRLLRQQAGVDEDRVFGLRLLQQVSHVGREEVALAGTRQAALDALALLANK